MKVGDLVMWNYYGKNKDVGMIGLVVSDYHDKGSQQVFKNVYWVKKQWVRPINPIHLEVISESR